MNEPSKLVLVTLVPTAEAPSVCLLNLFDQPRDIHTCIKGSTVHEKSEPVQLL